MFDGKDGVAGGRSVDAVDDRVRVADATDFPFSAVGRMGVGCSGAMIGPYHFLTAAHCVLSGSNIRPGADLQVSLGQNGSSDKPFGTAETTFVRVYDEYRISDQWEHDWAVLTLDSDRGLHRLLRLPQLRRPERARRPRRDDPPVPRRQAARHAVARRRPGRLRRQRQGLLQRHPRHRRRLQRQQRLGAARRRQRAAGPGRPRLRRLLGQQPQRLQLRQPPDRPQDRRPSACGSSPTTPSARRTIWPT